MAQTLQSPDRTITLPKYARGGFRELIESRVSKPVTLSGRMFVDYEKSRGGWVIQFDAITAAEYANIRQVYDDQLSGFDMLLFSDTRSGVSNVSVFMNMPPERSISWNQEAVVDLTIVLEREDADN